MMKIAIVGSVFAVLAVGALATAQAQNGGPSTPLIQPPTALSPIVTPALPFVYTLPPPPVIPSIHPTSPVQPFVESPVPAYGRVGTPMTPPAAPVVGTRSTPLTPNGVLLSNGAIVAPNTVAAPAQPPANEPAFQTQQIQSTFRIVGDGTPDSRRFNGERGPQVLFPGTIGTELMPIPPTPLNAPALNTGQTRPMQPRAGASFAEIIELLGDPVLTVTQSNGQILYFKDGSQVVMREGVSVR